MRYEGWSHRVRYSGIDTVDSKSMRKLSAGTGAGTLVVFVFIGDRLSKPSTAAFSPAADRAAEGFSRRESLEGIGRAWLETVDSLHEDALTGLWC